MPRFRMFNIGLVALASAFAPLIRATIPEWGQCGGAGFTGDTTCASGTVCVAVNPYYSQCLVGTATTSSVSATSAGTSPSSTPATTSSTAATSPTATPTGFVKVSGQKFMLDDDEFTVVGNNAYWVGLFGYSVADMNAAFADIANSGATSVRTLGFNDVTTPNGIYYQSWSNGVPTVNTGPTGLENFDTMVAAAKANGLRLIITLTNNWSDYGGMDVYVSQITGTTNHDWFYTNEDVKAAYKNYVKTFVTRYLNEPGILAWELANEPRCLGSTGTSSGTCTNAVITSWVEEMSAYIKSIDSNHLVAIGDEGFINDPGNPSYPYQGTLGIDFEANLNISTIDFGTFHMYPMSWGESADPTSWGVQWIADHQAFGVKANKPVIVEEFGVTSDQIDIYPAWFEEIISSGLAGDLPWQAGSHLSVGNTPDDGYAIYPDTPVYALVQEYAATLKARG